VTGVVRRIESSQAGEMATGSAACVSRRPDIGGWGPDFVSLAWLGRLVDAFAVGGVDNSMMRSRGEIIGNGVGWVSPVISADRMASGIERS